MNRTNVSSYGSSGRGSSQPDSFADKRGGYSVFIGGLAFEATEDNLRRVFPNAVTVRIQRDRETGKSRGFGFVDFNTRDECIHAVKALDGTEVAGRKIRISEANTNTSSTRDRLDNAATQRQPYARRSRSRSRDASRNRASSADSSESDRLARREQRRERMKNRLREAGAGWDRKPTADEVRAQEEENRALISAHTRGEITTIRADLQKAMSSRGGDKY